MLESLDIVKDKDESVAGWKAGDGTLQGEPVNRAGEEGVRGAETAPRAIIGRRVHGLIERNQVEALAPQLHENDIDRQPVQPRRKGRVAAEGGDFAVQLQEGFLHKVFSFGHIAHHAQAEGVNASFVQGIKQGESLMVSGLGSSQGVKLAAAVVFAMLGWRGGLSHGRGVCAVRGGTGRCGGGHGRGV